MSYFYKKDYMKIKKGKKKFTFFMEINMNDSFTRILWYRVALRYFKVIKQTTEDGYKKLEVKAKSIESLKSYLKKKDLEYDLVLKLMYNIATQIFLLKQKVYPQIRELIQLSIKIKSLHITCLMRWMK